MKIYMVSLLHRATINKANTLSKWIDAGLYDAEILTSTNVVRQLNNAYSIESKHLSQKMVLHCVHKKRPLNMF